MTAVDEIITTAMGSKWNPLAEASIVRVKYDALVHHGQNRGSKKRKFYENRGHFNILSKWGGYL